MSHPLLDNAVIDCPPAEYLAQAGSVFAQFGDQTQDSGNVSYGVEIGPERFFVKTAGPPDDTRWYLSHAERVALLRNAVLLHKSCAHPALVPLVHVIESPHGPLLVYAWVSGELLHGNKAASNDISLPLHRFTALPVELILAALDQIYELHEQLAQAGWIAVDFYDGCLIYDFARHRMYEMDLDMYHTGPFINQMGRMFGSSRFMAPEEFQKGALIDQRSNVFTMGRTAAVFLGQGTLERGSFRGGDRLFAVVRRACAPEPDRRFQTVQEFQSAWLGARKFT